jgi:deoxyribodipyrimidine photo-lyase
VASFLTKNLFIDWRLGEEFFAQYLMDYDLASNVGGWQWAASCGTDAQPYFRIFNPFTQGQNFDPDAIYIQKYLPELRKLNPELIHDQKAVEANFDGKVKYPKPIVSYKDSRQMAINAFKGVL